MVVFGDGCVGCGLPCLGDNCIYRNVISCTCDKCKKCILKEYRTVWDRLMDD